MSASLRVADLVARTGQAVVLRRVVTTADAGGGGVTTTPADFTVKARVRDFGAHEIAGLVQQGDRQVLIAADGLDTAPEINDKMQIDGNWLQVVGVVTLRDGAQPILYRLQVRG